jgi:three-Cys-motif partner protein
MEDHNMPPLARDAGPWTILKLTFLREYLKAYAEATKSIPRRSDVCFMDLFAGPGWDRDRDTGELVEGSPLIAMSLYPGFGRFILMDLEQPNITQLDQEASQRDINRFTHTIIGDCNLTIDDALNHVPIGGATFCFVDPAGADAHWSTVTKIAQHKPQGSRKIELFILFPYPMAIVRFLVRSGDPNLLWRLETARRVDSVMPDTRRWRQVYSDRNQGLITPEEARRRFAYIYWMGLKSLGYQHVLNPKLLTTPTGRPLYYLYFASDHPAGERIMSHVLNKSRKVTNQPAIQQLELGFSQDELWLPSVSDPWDFKDGEPWYDDVSPIIEH